MSYHDDRRKREKEVNERAKAHAEALDALVKPDENDLAHISEMVADVAGGIIEELMDRVREVGGQLLTFDRIQDEAYVTVSEKLEKAVKERFTEQVQEAIALHADEVARLEVEKDVADGYAHTWLSTIADGLRRKADQERGRGNGLAMESLDFAKRLDHIHDTHDPWG